jgi:hypothetical protein
VQTRAMTTRKTLELTVIASRDIRPSLLAYDDHC